MKKVKNKRNKYADINNPSALTGKYLNLNRNLAVFNPHLSYLLALTGVAVILSIIQSLLISHLSLEAAMIPAVLSAAVFFFSYLIARELDPDRVYGAYIGGFLALIATMIWGMGSIVVPFWMLMILRLLNRTSGASAGLLDHLFILIAAFYLVRDGQWAYAALTALIYALESKMPNGSHHSLYAAGLAFLIASFAPQLPYVQTNIPNNIFVIMIVATVLFLPVIKMSEHVRSLSDRTKLPLIVSRLQIAQSFAILVSFGMVWFYGQDVIRSFIPIWAAVLGTSIYLPIAAVLNRNKD